MKRVAAFTPDSGKTHANEYGEWLSWFKDAVEHQTITIHNPPLCWVPFLIYARIPFTEPMIHYSIDSMFPNIGVEHLPDKELREVVEVAAASRPELVDALWKYDVEWNVKDRRMLNEKQFTVANNSAYFRSEMMHWMKTMSAYRTNHRKNAVILPCSADKPYPSLLHKKVKEMLPGISWHLLIASGVTGIAPEEMWSEMPEYDCGMPNEWRLLQASSDYFSRNHYDNIIVYLDYYNYTVVKALMQIPNNMFQKTNIVVINPIRFYENYLDLESPHRLAKLKQVISEVKNG